MSPVIFLTLQAAILAYALVGGVFLAFSDSGDFTKTSLLVAAIKISFK